MKEGKLVREGGPGNSDVRNSEGRRNEPRMNSKGRRSNEGRRDNERRLASDGGTWKEG